MALAGKDANLKVTAAVGTTANAEAFSLVSGTSATYVVTDLTKRHFDRDVAPTVYVGASTASDPGHTVNSVQGRITFSSTVAAAVTADLTYLTATKVAGGREWTLNVQEDMFEISEFGSSGWKTYQPNVVGATVSIGRYWSDSAFFDQLNTDQALIVELLPASTGLGRYEGYVYVNQDSVATPVDGVVGESVDFVVDGALHWTTE